MKNETDMDYIVSLTEIASITGVDTIGDAKEIYVVYKIYQFKVDDKLETEFISIVENYAPDVTITSNVKSYEGKNADGKYIAKVEVKVESKELVQSIELETVNGTIAEVPTQLPYTKEIEVEIRNKYITKVTAKDGKVKKYVVEEKKEETIGSVSEFVAFRDAVNSGLTYEGKTISLTQDLDLSSVCYKVDGTTTNDVSWEPIGTETISFAGTFDGKKHAINNLYINSNKYKYAGLFCSNNGIIQNIIMNNINIYNYSNNNISIACGAVVVYNNNTIRDCGINSGNIKAYNATTITSGWRDVTAGGVAAYSRHTIENCYNKASVRGDTYNSNYTDAYIGGIVGNSEGVNSIVKNSYNTGDIYSNRGTTGGIVGVVTISSTNYKSIINCYNVGIIGTSANYNGGIIGMATKYVTINNCYYTNNIGYNSSSSYGNPSMTNVSKVSVSTLQGYASTLGDAFTDDIQDKDGNYLNNGYPILKWQVEE